MEREGVKGFTPEIVTLAVAEIPVVTKLVSSIAENTPLNPQTLIPLVVFYTFYVGIPAAIVVRACRIAFSRPKPK